jgi:hypothetical protein
MGGYTGAVYIVADQFFVGNAAGDTFTALFSISGGDAYLDGNFIATGTIKGVSIDAEEISTTKLTIGGVTTDRLALEAVTAYDFYYNDYAGSGSGAFSGARTFADVTLTRTSGTTGYILIEAEFRHNGLAGDNIGSIQLRRIISGVSTTIKTFTFYTPSLGVAYTSYETFPHYDTDAVSGSVTYEAWIQTSIVEQLFRKVYMTATEIKR